MHLRGVLSPTSSRSPMNISSCIDEIQVTIYILIKWKSNPALAWESKPHACWWRCWCEWDAIVCLSVPHRVKTLWQSFLFYKHDDNNNPWHAWLHKKRLTIIRIVLALCHWDGIEIPSRVSDSYMCWFPSVGQKHVLIITKRQNKATTEACAVFFSFSFARRCCRIGRRPTPFIRGSRWKEISVPSACVVSATPLC